MKNTIQQILILSFIFCAAGIEIAAQTCATAPSGLIAWYRAEDNANDVSGNANHGSLQGGASFASGNVGRTFSFDGASGFVSVPNSSANSVIGSFTIEAWVRLNAYSPQFSPIVSKWKEITAVNRSYFLAVNSAGKLQFTVSPNGIDNASIISSSSVPLNLFTHVAAVLDVSAQTLRLYMSGVEIGQATGVSTVSISTEPVLIGAGDLRTSSLDFTSGLVDEVTIYNRALSASEIQTIFNAGSAGKCFAPTAASVQISGRITTANGRGIGKARVSLTDSNGETRAAITNSFGYYRFEDVAAGGNYILVARHKGYTFEPQVIFLTEEITDMNLTAKP